MPQTKLLSSSGKSHQKLHNIRPLNTRSRLRMYHSIQVEPGSNSSLNKNKNPHATIDTVGRDDPGGNNSFFYRHHVQIGVNCNYHINDALVKKNGPKWSVPKAEVERVIGDVRNQDFSLPLIEDCDKRCFDAFITLPHQTTIRTVKDLHKARDKHHHLRFQKQLSRQINNKSVDMKKVHSLVSTQQSELQSPSNPTISLPLSLSNSPSHLNPRSKLHLSLQKIHNFAHSPGHRYAQSLFTPSPNPQPYSIQLSSEHLVRKSMALPKGNVNFASYRQKIATRYDRVDPNWGMKGTHEDGQLEEQSKNWEGNTLDMGRMEIRRTNQVMSKYPIRQSMGLIVPRNL